MSITEIAISLSLGSDPLSPIYKPCFSLKVVNWDGLMNLFEQRTVNYESGKYRYVILVNSEKKNTKRLIILT